MLTHKTGFHQPNLFFPWAIRYYNYTKARQIFHTSKTVRTIERPVFSVWEAKNIVYFSQTYFPAVLYIDSCP